MNEIEIYQSGDNQTEIQVQFDGETAWLTPQYFHEKSRFIQR